MAKRSEEPLDNPGPEPKPLYNPPRWAWILAGIVVLGVFVKVYLGHQYAKYDTPEATSTAAPVASVAPPAASAPLPAAPAYEAPTDVAIGDVLSEYKANELRADGKFKGKLIRTHGTVGQVGKGIMGEPFVSIGTGAQFEIPSLQCLLADPADPEAVALSAGGKATVQGRVDRLLGNVIVKDCVVNPIAHLCRQMIAATGGKRCFTNTDTGDAGGVVFSEDQLKASGDMGMLDCDGASTKASVELNFDLMMKVWKDDPKSKLKTVTGSRRTGCYGVFWSLAKGKQGPFPEPLRAKVQAVFDAL